MKILYALQGTGNGHIARANELIPYFRKHAEVDVFVSGTNSQLPLLSHATKNKGISLFYSQKGGLDYKRIFIKNSLMQFTRSVWQFPIHTYDLIVNDYEPVTAYAAKLRDKRIVGLSHQAAVLHEASPKPADKRFFSELIFKKYAPTEQAYGFHFKKYHNRIFYPILRKSIREMKTSAQGYYLVYLPSFSNESLQKILEQIPVKWLVFSPFTTYEYTFKNVTFYPINQTYFLQKLAHAEGVLCGAGFEFPAEVLHLNKALYVIPIKGQFEQYCNYLALRDLGVMGSEDLNAQKLTEWITANNLLNIHFNDETEQLVEMVLSG